MLAVKAHYKDGVIDLLEPIPKEIREAELNIVVIPYVKEKPGNLTDEDADDTFTADDKKAYDEAKAGYKKGEYIELDEYMKKRGLSV